MSRDTSANVRHEAPHVNRTTRTAAIIDIVKRRAQAVLSDKSIDPQSRAMIRYAMETHDPWLAELVRRADAEEAISDTLDFSQPPDTSVHDSSTEKIEALTDLICRAGDEPQTRSAALLVLMSAIENCTHPKALANAAKHLAFKHCSELNLFGMVDAQVAIVEHELLANVV
jgi:hypothetical protein